MAQSECQGDAVEKRVVGGGNTVMHIGFFFHSSLCSSSHGHSPLDSIPLFACH